MLSAIIDRAVTRSWQRRTWLTYLLWPLSVVYCGWAMLRRAGYRTGLLRTHRFDVPVLIIGNITVGGTGKTPLVIWMVKQLREHGLTPGVVSRGYGGRTGQSPQEVTADSDPHITGDEPILIARRGQCPVVVHADRGAAVRSLLDRHRCNVVVADDGLQHYRLERDIEVAVVDAERAFGNGFCLPAGPLREPAVRIQACQFKVVNGRGGQGELSMCLRLSRLVAVHDSRRNQPLASFRGRKVHAVAGIGYPERFFSALQDAGIEVIRHPFPDHFRFTPKDLDFGDTLTTVMTEKDAVKCESFATVNMWFAEVETEVDSTFAEQVLAMLQTRK
ncbi:MAG: tetraacyldisaccharide 4'-kinase [Gammaproteobacteria bacterium]|nr:tetraacyldisaccharide 4'-kinase [Gammaproteobacteria bacterium]